MRPRWAERAVATRRLGIAGAAIVASIGARAPAYAEPPPTTNRALAESLFRDGRERMQAGDYAAACPKLQESQRIEPAIGTLLNLAVCHEAQGRLASAWAEFDSAADQARRVADVEREQLARRHARELEPRLSYVVIRVAVDRGVPVEILVDGVLLGAPAWGSPLPLDEGVHAIEARAPGRRGWRSTFAVSAGPARASVDVPALEAERPTPPAPVSPPADAPAAADRSAAAGRRTLGTSLVGLGAAGLAVGGALGVRALTLKRDRSTYCDGQNACTAEGVAIDGSARSAATASTIAFVAGGVVVAGGLALVLTAPRGPAAVTVTAKATGGATLELGTSW
jgi:hypothetical protein